MTLLDQALAAHGGREAFDALATLDLRLHCTGLALPTRGQPRALSDVRAHVALHHPHVRFHDWPRQGHSGVFDGWTTRVENAGEVVAEREGRRKRLRWDDLDVMHFAGYALWSYLTAPFLLTRPDVDVAELPGRRLRVRLPQSIPSHSAEQIVHLDDTGRIARVDYTAEVFSRWARAANVCLDYEEVAGVLIPVKRRVVPRGPGGRALPGPTLVGITFHEFHATPRKDRGPGFPRGLDPVLH